MAKGSQGERDTCHELSLWWTNGKRSDIFWRTSGSGARATVRAKSAKKTAYSYGDITFIDPIGKPLIDLFLIENKIGYSTKHKIYKSKKTGKLSIQKAGHGIRVLDFVDGLDNAKEPLLLKWWKKAEIEKDLANRKYSAIIFKRDHKQKCIMFERQLFNQIAGIEASWTAFIGGNTITIQLDNALLIVIISFKEFLEWCSPETIKFLSQKKLVKRKK